MEMQAFLNGDWDGALLDKLGELHACQILQILGIYNLFPLDAEDLNISQLIQIPWAYELLSLYFWDDIIQTLTTEQEFSR